MGGNSRRFAPAWVRTVLDWPKDSISC